jgi:uncharacterized protein
MKANIAAFLSGVVFGLGLCIGGMTLPSKVVGFLDFTGQWDASLAFVMAGAVAVCAIVFRLATRRRSPLFASAFAIPTRRDIDGSLITGAALFGIGWGLGGFCPGPALTSLAWTAAPVITFVAAMCAGIYLHSLVGLIGVSSAPRNATVPGAMTDA